SGLIRWADRTSLRTTLNEPAARERPDLAHAPQPEPMWTITRKARTPHPRDVASAIGATRHSPHNSKRHRAGSAESPEPGPAMGTDEKRDFDQRQPARDAGCHPRGRPAR